MSAYVVDREHVSYLVRAAESRGIGCRYGSNFSWYYKAAGNRGILNGNGVEVGQMLWDQNVKAVKCRYPDCTGNNLPGPIGEDFILVRGDLAQWFNHNFDPIQVIASCRCYAYQACEDPKWEETEAFAFIESLKSAAITALPGMDEVAWGAPNN